jgi:hypothetical protein
MDPRIQIRIRIHPKMSWIRNTDFNIHYLVCLIRYSSNPSLTQAALQQQAAANVGEYERPPPYYYPGPPDGGR